MKAWLGTRIAQRREVVIVLPAALLMVVLLSTYTLYAYRGALDLLLDERRVEADQLARQLTGELMAAPGLPDADALRRRMPQARNVAVLDAEGKYLVGNATPRSVVPVGLLGPRDLGPIIGSARFKRGDAMLSVRVELPVTVLRSRQRSLAILTPVLLTVNVAITLLVLLFLRSLLAPFDRMVERARHAGQEVPESQDEVDFLVETFEKALQALAKPVAESRASGEEIDELKALEKTLARSLESGVLLLDGQGQILALNELGTAWLGLESASPVGKPASVALERHKPLAEILEQALRQERSIQRVECTLSTAQGDRVLGVTAHPLRRDDAALRGFLVMFSDLTEVQREARRRQLEDSLSHLGELTAGVAHELRNSLATLRGYLTLIDRSQDTETVHDYLGEIGRESDHLERVLEDFLMFARPGSARLQEVDLLGLTHRAASDPALSEGAVRVITDRVITDRADLPQEGTELTVKGDSQLLERALRNVLSNAVEANARAGEPTAVEARVRPDATGVEVVIEDRGDGLSPEARERLFDPFFTQRAGGVGMGLAVTRRIVLLHAGRITVENRDNGGTRAVIWLPRGRTDTKGNDSGSIIAAEDSREGAAKP